MLHFVQFVILNCWQLKNFRLKIDQNLSDQNYQQKSQMKYFKKIDFDLYFGFVRTIKYHQIINFLKSFKKMKFDYFMKHLMKYFHLDLKINCMFHSKLKFK